MTKFEVGQPYPKPNEDFGVEQLILELNTAFFDVVFYSNSAAGDAKIFTKGPIRYGVYTNSDIPFFLVDFINEFSVDSSINFHKVLNEEQAEAWLNSSANVVNMYLVDAQTNILHGMRMISLTSKAAELIRDTCEIQDGSYENAESVDRKIQEIMKYYNTDMMFVNAKIVQRL